MKPATPADPVTRVRQRRQRMVHNRVSQGRDDNVLSIAKRTLRRVNCQAAQHNTQHPRDSAALCRGSSCCDSPTCDKTIHALTINPPRWAARSDIDRLYTSARHANAITKSGPRIFANQSRINIATPAIHARKAQTGLYDEPAGARNLCNPSLT